MLTNNEVLEIVSDLITNINKEKNMSNAEKASLLAPLFTKHAQLSKVTLRAGHLYARVDKNSQNMPTDLGTKLKMPVFKK